MSIKLIVHPSFFGSRTVDDGWVKMEVAGASTVGECLARLLESSSDVIRTAVFDDSGKLNGATYVIVNGLDISPAGLAMPLKDGDEVRLVYLSAGCC